MPMPVNAVIKNDFVGFTDRFYYPIGIRMFAIWQMSPKLTIARENYLRRG